jgi:hypothetical protein
MTKGVLLSKVISSDVIYVYLCIVDYDMFEASLLDLLPSLPKGKILTLKGKLDGIADKLLNAYDAIHGLLNIKESMQQFPKTLIDPEMLDYDGYFAQTYESNVVDGKFVLYFADCEPVYRLLAGQTGLDVDLSYTTWIRGCYRRVSTKPAYNPPPVPEVSIPFIVNGLRCALPDPNYYPTSGYTSMAGYTRYYYDDDDWSYGDLKHVNVWGSESPRPEGHFFNPYPGSVIDFLITGQGGAEHKYLLYSTSPYMSAWGSADYPAIIPDGYVRSFPPEIVQLERVGFGAETFLILPGVSVVVLPILGEIALLPIQPTLELLQTISGGKTIWLLNSRN